MNLKANLKACMADANLGDCIFLFLFLNLVYAALLRLRRYV